ncbi:hypothetical protein M427DRAFT_276289 [Gonapodya prolifera JEL478]|uniref:C3H1-type domain-containing protein n=1 Tax=Gonapodya prolifera (strain JEL478) TaxID=1344416 RepID=A0A139AY55_GONPJ|nr:hypothetical protein M427DRAFT_276289 [Gonapodya prolifera JEL478]|eukprot:KXS21678.1 hypothetical protein M427DRAFT_276289 [Gonapodya prolifera JEL478]
MRGLCWMTMISRWATETFSSLNLSARPRPSTSMSVASPSFLGLDDEEDSSASLSDQDEGVTDPGGSMVVLRSTLFAGRVGLDSEGNPVPIFSSVAVSVTSDRPSRNGKFRRVKSLVAPGTSNAQKASLQTAKAPNSHSDVNLSSQPAAPQQPQSAPIVSSSPTSTNSPPESHIGHAQRKSSVENGRREATALPSKPSSSSPVSGMEQLSWNNRTTDIPGIPSDRPPEPVDRSRSVRSVTIVPRGNGRPSQQSASNQPESKSAVVDKISSSVRTVTIAPAKKREPSPASNGSASEEVIVVDDTEDEEGEITTPSVVKPGHKTRPDSQSQHGVDQSSVPQKRKAAVSISTLPSNPHSTEIEGRRVVQRIDRNTNPPMVFGAMDVDMIRNMGLYPGSARGQRSLSPGETSQRRSPESAPYTSDESRQFRWPKGADAPTAIPRYDPTDPDSRRTGPSSNLVAEATDFMGLTVPGIGYSPYSFPWNEMDPAPGNPAAIPPGLWNCESEGILLPDMGMSVGMGQPNWSGMAVDPHTNASNIWRPPPPLGPPPPIPPPPTTEKQNKGGSATQSKPAPPSLQFTSSVALLKALYSTKGDRKRERRKALQGLCRNIRVKGRCPNEGYCPHSHHRELVELLRKEEQQLQAKRKVKQQAQLASAAEGRPKVSGPLSVPSSSKQRGVSGPTGAVSSTSYPGATALQQQGNVARGHILETNAAVPSAEDPRPPPISSMISTQSDIGNHSTTRRKVCTFYKEGICPLGLKCTDLHVDGDADLVGPGNKCQFWFSLGFCKNGDVCPFSHV